MLPSKPSWEQIALGRVTFGARDRDIDEVKRIGWRAWVEEQLAPPVGDDPALDAYLRAMLTSQPLPEPYKFWVGREAPPKEPTSQ